MTDMRHFDIDILVVTFLFFCFEVVLKYFRKIVFRFLENGEHKIFRPNVHDALGSRGSRRLRRAWREAKVQSMLRLPRNETSSRCLYRRKRRRELRTSDRRAQSLYEKNGIQHLDSSLIIV